MSARETKISRRLLLAGGSAFGLGALSAPASSQAPEKITYLFPAPPILPAFGPIRLAQGKGYFTAAGLEVSFAVGRGGVDVAKQVGAGNAPLGGIVADGPIMVRGNGVPVKIVAAGRGQRRAARQVAGVLRGEGLHPEGDAGRGTLQQRVHQVALLGQLISTKRNHSEPHTRCSPSPACGGGLGRGWLERLYLVACPPPCPSPASGRGDDGAAPVIVPRAMVLLERKAPYFL